MLLGLYHYHMNLLSLIVDGKTMMDVEQCVKSPLPEMEASGLVSNIS